MWFRINFRQVVAVVLCLALLSGGFEQAKANPVGVVARVAGGAAAEQVILGIAEAAGTAAADVPSGAKLIARFEFEYDRKTKDIKLHPANRERLEELKREINVRPVPAPEKPGFGRVLIKTANVLLATDLILNAVSTYRAAKDKAELVETIGIVEANPDFFPKTYGDYSFRIIPGRDDRWGAWEKVQVVNPGRGADWYENATPAWGCKVGSIVSFFVVRGGNLYADVTCLFAENSRLKQQQKWIGGAGDAPVNTPIYGYHSSTGFETGNPTEYMSFTSGFDWTQPTSPTSLPEYQGLPERIPIYVPLEEDGTTVGSVVVTPSNTPINSPTDVPDFGGYPTDPPGGGTDPENPTDPPPDAERWSQKFKGLVTTKFPFSLPWDLYAVLSFLNAPPKAPKIEVDKSLQVAGVAMPLQFEYDFAWLDPYMRWFRAFIVLGFCFYLINATRRLMGGAQ